MDQGKGSRGTSYTDTELLELLRALAETVDGPVIPADVPAANRYPGLDTFQRRFGSWKEAKEQAGIE